MGTLSDKGQGVETDKTKAVRWYRLAAEQGHACAQSLLGLSLMKGIGVDVTDKVEAVKWFRLSAEKGLAVGQYYLGRCYRWGEGVQKDIVEAVKWYSLAAEQGESR